MTTYQFADIESRLAAVIILAQAGTPFRFCADLSIEANTTPEQDQLLTHPREDFCVVQEGGSSTEIYLGGADTEAEATALRHSYAEGAYRSSEVVKISAAATALGDVFYTAAEAILQASLAFSYPEDSDE